MPIRHSVSRWMFAAVAAALWCASALPTCAQQPSGDAQRLAAIILEQGNVESVVEAWKRELVRPGGFADCQCGAETEARLNAAWQQAVNAAFDSKAIVSHFGELFGAAFSLAELQELVSMGNTPIGLKLAAAERNELLAVESPDGPAKLETARAALEKDLRRKTLVTEISQLTDGGTASRDAAKNIYLALAIGLELSKPAGQPRKNESEILLEFQNRIPVEWRNLEQIILARDARVLETINTEELVQVRDFYASALGRKSVRVSHAAFNTAMYRQALLIGEVFGRVWSSPPL